MVRVKRGNVALKRKKKYFKFCKGYRHSNSKLSTMAMEQSIQSLYFAYIGRKLKKRNFRKYWIYRINSALSNSQIKYSPFLGLLKKMKIFLNKKMLAYLAYNDPFLFQYLVQKCKKE